MNIAGQPEVQLVITLNPQTSKMSISGPIENKLVAYGMLALAADAIREHNANDSRIVRPEMVFGPQS